MDTANQEPPSSTTRPAPRSPALRGLNANIDLEWNHSNTHAGPAQHKQQWQCAQKKRWQTETPGAFSLARSSPSTRNPSAIDSIDCISSVVGVLLGGRSACVMVANGTETLALVSNRGGAKGWVGFAVSNAWQGHRCCVPTLQHPTSKAACEPKREGAFPSDGNSVWANTVTLAFCLIRVHAVVMSSETVSAAVTRQRHSSGSICAPTIDSGRWSTAMSGLQTHTSRVMQRNTAIPSSTTTTMTALTAAVALQEEVIWPSHHDSFRPSR